MRFADWEERLAEVIAAYQGGVFIWGVRDCFRLPLAVVEAVTGDRLWAGVRPYRSARGAALRLARHGFREVGDALAAVLPECAASFAGRGDVGVISEDGREAGVAVLGHELAGVAPGAGLTILPRARLVRAFRVG